MRITDPLEAMQHAAWHLRMELAGLSSYSGAPGDIDKGYAKLLLKRLDQCGFKVERKTTDEIWDGWVVDASNAQREA